MEGSKAKGADLLKQIQEASSKVLAELGHHKNEYGILTKDQEIIDYFKACEKLGTAVIDTETTGVDTFKDTIVGIPLYAEGLQPIYIPIHHISPSTGIELPGQADRELLIDLLGNMKIKWDMYNAPFDVKKFKVDFGIDVECRYDGYDGVRLLDENRKANGLKDFWFDYCAPDGTKKEGNYNYYFGGLPASVLPIDIFTLYAAGDGPKTADVVNFILNILERPNMSGVKYVFENIETPRIKHQCDMELYGIGFDDDKAKALDVKYEKVLAGHVRDILEILEPDKQSCLDYIESHPNTTLTWPPNFNSPDQMKTLYYEVLKYPVQYKKNAKTGIAKVTTDKSAREKLNTPLTRAIQEYQDTITTIDLFLKQLPEKVEPSTGRIHASFKFLGTSTGRISCTNPNLQQISAKNKDIRQIFKAKDDHIFISMDFSQLWAEVKPA